MTSTTPDVQDESPATGKGTGRLRWVALGFMSLGVSMVMIDATIVNVAIPVISSDLSLTPTDVQWVNSIYSLTFAALLITLGKAGDVFGRRLLFVLGATLFLVSSIIAARSQAGEVLIFGRFVQGIGGAMMIPASLSLLNTIFRGKDRAIAFAVWGATIGSVAAIGPLLGGFLTTQYSWRWAFLINLPVALILVIGTLLIVPESKDDDARRGLDIVGVLTSALGIGALVFGLIEGQRYGWWSVLGEPTIGPFTWPLDSLSPIPFVFLLSAVMIYVFVRVERARAAADRVVILDLDLFRIRSFAWGQVVGMVIMFGEFGILLTLPLFLQNVLGFTAIHAGATLAFVMVGALVSTPPSGRLVGRFGAIQIVRAGLALEIIGMLGLGWAYTIEATTWTFAPWLVLFGMGVGLSTAQITNVILRDVPVHKSGQASGTQSTSRQIGTALGVAVLGAVLWTSLGNSLGDQLNNQPGVSAEQSAEVTELVVSSTGTALGDLREQDPAIGLTADTAYAESTRFATWVGSAFLLIGLVGTFQMRSQNPPGRRPDEDAEAAAAPVEDAPTTSAAI
jgi:EmrB/QacA subfamily drug resistance transporter